MREAQLLLTPGSARRFPFPDDKPALERNDQVALIYIP